MKMKSSSVISFALLISAMVLTLCFMGTDAQEEMLCRGQKLNLTAQQMSFITDCLKEFKINSVWEVPPERMACFGVCAMDKKGLLTPDGKLDHDKIYDYIYHMMKPDEVRKPLMDGTEKCIKDHGTQVKVDNDPTCSQYMETGQCVHMLFHDICNQ